MSTTPGARHGFAALLILALAGGAVGGCQQDTVSPPAPAASPSFHDLLLITVDTLRADALGFAGNPRAATPNLDRLATAGRVFERAHAHNVTTLPSHANILTGLYPYQHGVRANSGFVLPETLPTAATLLAAEGFATAAFVAAFPLDARFGLGRGFEVYDDTFPQGGTHSGLGTPERRGDVVVAAALDWWRRHADERRFLWVHLFDPHAPYAPSEPFKSRFPENPYLGEVAAVDAYLEPLLGPLLDPDTPPTLVVFTADHGEALGDHGELTHGLFAYEPTLKVPLVLWGSGIAAGRDRRSARHVDILPTLLAAAGIEAPAELPGRSLLGQEPAEDASTVTYFESLNAHLDRGWAPLRGVMQGADKLIVLPLPELYDLASDPEEQRNLVAEERRRTRALSALLPQEAVWPPPRGKATAEESARLRNLGYITGDAAAKETYTAADDPKNLVALDRKTHTVIDLLKRGRPEEAAALAREIVAERPSMSVGYDYLAQALLDSGRLPEAIEVMKGAVTQGVASGLLQRQLALSLAQVGRVDEAVALLEPLAAAGDLDVLNAYAQVLSDAGRQADAHAQLERVLIMDGDNPLAHQHLALVALRQQAWEEAEAAARTALERDPGLPLAWNYLGVALYNLGRPGESLEAWDAAVALEPKNLDLLYNIAVVAAEEQEIARAREALQRFIAAASPAQHGGDLERARAFLRQLGG